MTLAQITSFIHLRNNSPHGLASGSKSYPGQVDLCNAGIHPNELGAVIERSDLSRQWTIVGIGMLVERRGKLSLK